MNGSGWLELMLPLLTLGSAFLKSRVCCGVWSSKQHDVKSRAGAWIPELQLLEIIPVVATIPGQQTLCMGLGVRGEEEVGDNSSRFASALQISPKHFTGKNGAGL